MDMDRPETGTRTSRLWIATAWAIVTLPLAWGVFQSVVKSLPLFHTAAPADLPRR